MVGAPHLQKYYVFTEFTDVVPHRGLSPEFRTSPFSQWYPTSTEMGKFAIIYQNLHAWNIELGSVGDEYIWVYVYKYIYIVYIFVLIWYYVLSLKWYTWSNLPLQPFCLHPGPHRRAQRPSPLQPWGEAGRVDGGANAGVPPDRWNPPVGNIIKAGLTFSKHLMNIQNCRNMYHNYWLIHDQYKLSI